MSVITEIRREREDLARVLRNHPGVRKLIKDLYPDSAHFIYELLQNAEDTGANNVRFILFNEYLLFEHDGRSFDRDDIEAITNIGEGTGEADDDRIGRFGVGFKSVFNYTETPHIWSPDFSFKISEFVLPWEIEENPSLGEKTRFKFHFDNRNKLPPDAFEETRIGLEAISENALLFLSNIKLISWQVDGRPAMRLSSIVKPIFDGEIPAEHIEILMKRDGVESRSSHFLRFTHPVKAMGSQFTAIAFKLDALQTEGELIENTLFADEFKISPTNPGRVSAFFTLEKEHSGLCFHIHAPFVTTPDRASIKETRKNDPLFEQLAQLAARSLSKIRDLQLLNPEFLAVLPNDRDELTKQYKCIREKIIGEMNGSPLTPTYRGKHKPARKLLQAKASLKSLLKPKDIKLLVEVDYGEKRIDWAIGATQRNSRQDRFLSSLDIREWGIAEFQKELKERLDPDSNSSNPDLLKKNLRNSNRMSTRERLFYARLEISRMNRVAEEEFLKRLKSKSKKWHQQFYALLFEELSDPSQLSNCWIVRLSSEEYKQGSECYFPMENETSQEDHLFPYVARRTYTSGKSKKEKSNARSFLEAVGVREVGEREQIKAILELRYSYEAEIPDNTTYKNDLTRFIALVEENSDNGKIFGKFYVLKGAKSKLLMPHKAYFDSPYLETGLNVFYELLGDDTCPVAPVDYVYYKKIDISREEIVKFGEASGVKTELNIIMQSTSKHQDKDILRNFPNTIRNDNRIDQDYTINHLDRVLEHPPKKLAQLIWKTMRGAKEKILTAKYRPNASHPLNIQPSSLILLLQKHAWIPQGNDSYSRPCEASQDQLPAGFPFDSGEKWIEAITFGKDVKREVNKRRVFRETLGLKNDEEADRVKWFIGLTQEEQERMQSDFKVSDFVYSQNGSKNRARRDARLRDEPKRPIRPSEKRPRSITLDYHNVKETARSFLKGEYTNKDGVMICQVCKKALPFKLTNGEYYFEAVNFIHTLNNYYDPNYLALCPNHAAMYQHANGNKDQIKDLFLNLNENELKITLAKKEASILFTNNHRDDLKLNILDDDSD